MRITEAKCPNCGANIDVSNGANRIVCSFCRSNLLIEYDNNDIIIDQKEDLERDPWAVDTNSNSQLRETSFPNKPGIQYLPDTKPANKIWLWVLGWIFVFPIPLMILVRKNDNLSKVVKYGVITLGWIIYAIFIIAGAQIDSEKKTNHTSPAESVQDNPVAGSQERKDEDTDSSDDVLETDLEILSRKGHATYYDNIEKAHETWGDIENANPDKIIITDNSLYSQRYARNTLLTMSSYKESPMINYVNISFNKANPVIDLDIDQVCELISTYMPYDIIDKYYKLSGSKHIVPNKTNELKSDYYVITYSRNDKKDKGENYYGSIDVIIGYDSGHLVYASIGFGTPRWMDYLEKNDYKEKKWKMDLEKYR